MIKVSFLLLGLFSGLFPALAEEKAKEKVKEANYSTNMDFDSTMIDGKMKAPSGFFLQGRNRQSLSNMVKLRSNFSGRLKDSEEAVKALIK